MRDPGEIREAALDMSRVVYCTQHQTGLSRRKVGKTLYYLDPAGRRVTSERDLRRIEGLKIPPAWTNVWISAKASSHLQATGRDSKERMQYLYHADWRSEREQAKFERLLAFARFIPAFRRRAKIDARQPGMNKRKVLAAVCSLLDRTLIRVGNEEYAARNGSYGLTTMKNRHVRVQGEAVRFSFPGKSGKHHDVTLHDPVLARIVARCRELPGKELFEYCDDAGGLHDVTAPDVNQYIGEISRARFTAKDFRTWHGTVLAAQALKKRPTFSSQREARRNLVWAGRCVARKLGNTLAICRRSYIHPGIFDSYLAGEFKGVEPVRISGLRAAERFTYALLQRWHSTPGPKAGRRGIAGRYLR